MAESSQRPPNWSGASSGLLLCFKGSAREQPEATPFIPCGWSHLTAVPVTRRESFWLVDSPIIFPDIEHASTSFPIYKNQPYTPKCIIIYYQCNSYKDNINNCRENDLLSQHLTNASQLLTREFLTKTPRPMNNQHKIYYVQVTSHLMNNGCWNEFFLGFVLEWGTKN